MDEVIEDGRLPDGSGAICGENVFEAVSTEGTEGHASQAENRSESDHQPMLARTRGGRQYPRPVNVLLILLAAAACYFLATRLYAPFLLRQLGADPERATPAERKKDGRDFMPAKPYVLFAHHFAAIAGAGPIVGPTLAVAYGYLPALLWVVIGAIFLGAVHDITTLYISVREDGRSVADIARHYLGNAGYILIVSFLVIGLFMITATFLNLSVTALTSMYPAEKVGMEPVPLEALREAMGRPANSAGLHPFHSGTGMPTAVKVTDGVPVLMAKIGGIASTSVLFITLCAPLLGFLIYKRHTPAWLNYSLASVLCLASVVLGLVAPVVVTPDVWRIFMTAYVVLASAIPVWLLLMPRDFVNVQILYGGILAVLAGLVVGAISGTAGAAPAFDHAASIPAWDPVEGMKYVGMLWPMLFITVSCGAISGFHCLVSSGTSAKQLGSERDLRAVGYNTMLLESLLAVAVILTLLLGLDWESYKHITYGEKNPILAIALATGNLIHQAFHLPVWVGCVLGILLLEGFVVTTLDVAVRLNRYLLEEVWTYLFKSPPAILRNVWFNTGLCVGVMFLLSRSNTLPVLWQVFGSANQMMGAMALLVAAVWLKAHGRRWWFVFIPAVLMFGTTLTSTALALMQNLARENYALVVTCGVLLGLGAGLAVLGGRILARPAP